MNDTCVISGLRKAAVLTAGLFVALYLVLCGAWWAEARIYRGKLYRVTERGAGSRDGSSWENALDLVGFRAKLKEENLTDGRPVEFWVAKGVYTPSDNDEDASFELRNGMALYGGFTGKETEREERDWEKNVTVLTGDIDRNDIRDSDGVTVREDDIQGKNSYHVLFSENCDKTAILDGFTVCGGRSSLSDGDDSGLGYGSGMFNSESSPTVENCTFSGNEAYYGGGMYNSGNSSPTVAHCTFTSNKAFEDGGGMCNEDGSSPVVTNCTFSGNWGGLGGGMSNESSSPTVTDCTFSGNGAFYGGGMNNSDKSNSVVTKCVFLKNGARGSGGMSNFNNSNPVVTNCTFVGNEAKDGNGGGMDNHDSSPTVTNCTFSENKTEAQGGGMSNESSSPTVTNSIFWENTGGEFFNDDETSAKVTHSVVQGGYEGGTNIVTDDPRLGPLQDNGGPTRTMALGEGSSAIGAGTWDVDAAVERLILTDQRGVKRPRETAPDIGACRYEAR